MKAHARILVLLLALAMLLSACGSQEASGGDATAWINYSNPEVDELFDLAAKEMDSEKRNEYYAELQTILRDEMPWLWIRFTDNLFGMQKTLTGLDPDPETYCEFRFVKTK